MKPRNRQSPKYSFGSWTLSATAIAGLLTPVAIVAPVRAAVLHNWNFDAASQLFTVTLPDGITPRFFLLAEPARIVLEIPNTTLGTATPMEQYSGAVRSIRLSEVANGARAVIELAPNTRLDPRHAELTSTALGNGQTAWTLRPLLQDAPTAPIAATPPAPVTTPTTAAPEAPPVAVSPIGEPESTETAVNDSAAPAAASTETPESASEATDTGAPVDAIAIEPEAAAAAVSIPVSPSADEVPPLPDAAAATPASLPDIANSATAGAARALPTGPDPLAGISTDATALEGAVSDNLTNLPPEQIPIDPFAADSQAAVTVPDLAEVPAVPTTTPRPDAGQTTASGLPADQVRPPSRRGTPTARSAPASPAPTVAAPPIAPPSTAPAPATLSTTASPPTAQQSSNNASVAASQVRPPVSEPSRVPSAPPTAAPSAATSPVATAAAQRPPATATVPPFLSTPSARNPNTIPPPTAERPSIPPPPTSRPDDGTVPFGAPLPQTKSVDDVSQSGAQRYGSVLPVGTRLSLQYVGTSPLDLTAPDPVYEVLVLTGDVYDTATGGVLLPAGAQVLGRFEGGDRGEQRFVAQSVSYGRDRYVLPATSDALSGTLQPDEHGIALSTGIGAAVITILSGFSGIGLISGAAMGAMAGLAESPRLVTIEPGMVIEVQVVSELPPLTQTPAIGGPYP